ncbi:MAG TPA: DUF6580 family putative transport protein [Saprospiraceae bacterium]|nr:DUF6580 family putative transport protein [Saprospiraceae bacterium]
MKLKENLWVVIAVIFVAIGTRIIPHYPNFTAVGAAALFGGAYLRRPYAVLIPILSIFISDLILNNLIYAKQFPDKYDGFVVFEPQTLWTYGIFIVIALMGSKWIREGKIFSVIGTSLAASVLFFLVSNFSVWPGSTIYPQTIIGLGTSYVAGIPFFWNTLVGDLFFVAIFFGGYELVKVLARKRANRTHLSQ